MNKLTCKDLEDAPMFTIFWIGDEWSDHITYNGMRPDDVIESDEDGPQDSGVIEQLELRKIVIGLHIEKNDESLQGQEGDFDVIDDIDAAVAYLRYNNKPIIKVPDKLTASSNLYKFYVVERMGW